MESRTVDGISPYDGLASNGRSWVYQIRCRDSESFVYDLGTWRGVVLGRAVTTLRSVETQPLAWGFVLSDRRDPLKEEKRELKEKEKKKIERNIKILYIFFYKFFVCFLFPFF